MLGRKKVDFKGNKNGIVLYYERELSFDELYDLVERKLAKARDFFRGAHLIGIDGPALELDQESKLAKLIEQKSGMKVLTLEPIEKNKPIEERVARFTFGDDSSEPAADPEPTSVGDQSPVATSSEEVEVEESEVVTIDPYVYVSDLALQDKTIFHRGTLRSGKRLDSKGHLIIIGDVNPGAEVSAEGNIVVLGTLRGFAFAGSGGDDSRIIIALKLMPTQIRIGTKITRSPDDGTSAPSYPEIASVRENRIIIEPLQ